MNLDLSISGKTILVIGGGGLLGKQFCQALINAEVNVIAVDNNKKSLRDLLQLSTKIKTFKVDITSEQEMLSMTQNLQDQNILVDGLIFCAGLDPKMDKLSSMNSTKLESYSLDQWQLEISTSLTGMFILFKNIGHILNNGSSIVVVASDLSVISPDQRIYNLNPQDQLRFKPLTYSAIKAGQIGIVRYLSTYWAVRNIRVNAISPGSIKQNQDKDLEKELCYRIPLGRLAKPDEFNNTVLFLLSNASSYLTGQNILIDGGRSVW